MTDAVAKARKAVKASLAEIDRLTKEIASYKCIIRDDYDKREAPSPAPGVTECATEGCERPATCYFERGGVGSHYCGKCFGNIVAALQPAEQPDDMRAEEAEPVAWMDHMGGVITSEMKRQYELVGGRPTDYTIPLYASPPRMARGGILSMTRKMPRSSRLALLEAAVSDMEYLLRPALKAAEADAARLRQELDEARQLVAEANNSLYGSQGYFHSTDGGPFDKYHLARPIEDLKASSREAPRLRQRVKALEEGLEPFATWSDRDEKTLMVSTQHDAFRHARALLDKPGGE